MAITALPEWPVAGDAAFAAKMDAVGVALPTTITEIDAVATAFNFNATNSTSTTNMSIAIASKAFTVEASKSYVVGMAVTIAYTTDATRWMRGEVTAYNSSTGAITVNVRVISTSTGTYAAWTISQAAVESSIGTHKVSVHTGNGSGSTNTKIRRFTTAMTNTGTAITYADNATLGSTFTINEDGFYAISYADLSVAATGGVGVSVNSTQLTTTILSITVADRLMMTREPGGALPGRVSTTTKLLTGDVVRPHNGASFDDTTNAVQFTIEKVGNV